MTARRLLAVAAFFSLCAMPAVHARQTDAVPAPDAKAAPSAASVANGQLLFKRHCQGCHGETGKGDGAAAKFLTGKLPDLGDKTAIGRRTDAELHDLIAQGKKGDSGTMPPFSARIKDADLQDLINFVRSLGQ